MEIKAPQKSVADGDAESESGIYRTVEFRMYCFKVLPCSKRFCHDWTNCPFAHPGEKARRRDPRVFQYTGVACPEMKMGLICTRGSACPFAHNVFEYWLHPSRFRTQPCNDGPNCRRRVCFFAHTLDELRVPTEDTENQAPVSPQADSCQSTDAEPLTSMPRVPQVFGDVALNDHADRSVEAPFLPALKLGNSGLSCSSCSETSLASQQTYLMSSLASSMLSQLPDPGLSELDASAEKPLHLEKTLTDLLNYDATTQQRVPLAPFNVPNYDTSALESGLHWNGGPPKLFVDRSQSVSNSFSGVLTNSAEIENLSCEFLESAVISKPPSQPFFLTSRLSNF